MRIKVFVLGVQVADLDLTPGGEPWRFICDVGLAKATLELWINNRNELWARVDLRPPLDIGRQRWEGVLLVLPGLANAAGVAAGPGAMQEAKLGPYVQEATLLRTPPSCQHLPDLRVENRTASIVQLYVLMLALPGHKTVMQQLKPGESYKEDEVVLGFQPVILLAVNASRVGNVVGTVSSHWVVEEVGSDELVFRQVSRHSKH
jgi:hypothetical protein